MYGPVRTVLWADGGLIAPSDPMTTEAATYALAEYLVRVPEVTDVSTYAGTSSPRGF